MVPLASSITTMAGLSGSTRRSSMRASVSIGSRPPKSIATVRGSVARLIGPSAALIAAAIRRAVVRSGLRRPRRSAVALSSANGHLALHRGAVGDAAGGRHAAGHRAGGAARGDGAGGQRALGDGIDLAVGGEQRGDQQRAAGQVGGIAERRDRDVDPAAGAGEGRQVGGDHHRGDVLGVQLGDLVARVDAQPLQHADQRFAGEHGVVELVAGAVQPDHQAVADQLVVAHALDVGDVLDAHLRRRRGQEPEQGGEGEEEGGEKRTVKGR